MQRRELYTVEGEHISRSRRFCPRCGPGVFLAEHEDRYTCGNCKYSEIKKPAKPKDTNPAAENKNEKAN